MTKDEWREIYEAGDEDAARELGDDGSMWAMRDTLAKFL